MLHQFYMYNTLIEQVDVLSSLQVQLPSVTPQRCYNTLDHILYVSYVSTFHPCDLFIPLTGRLYISRSLHPFPPHPPFPMATIRLFSIVMGLFLVFVCLFVCFLDSTNK